MDGVTTNVKTKKGAKTADLE